MKKIITTLLLSLPFVASFAQDQVGGAGQYDDPYARFQGLSLAQVYNEGVQYQRKRDFAQALPCFQYVADQGNAEAQYWTGFIYHHGSAGLKDDDQAIKYWTLASEQNHGLSQFNLGLLYYGISDYTNAVKYWELSVENNYPEAMSNIGFCYDQGLGVARDEVKAFEWFNRAAENGDVQGLYNVALYYELGKAGLPADKEKAVEGYAKAWGLGFYKAKEALDRLQQ